MKSFPFISCLSGLLGLLLLLAPAPAQAQEGVMGDMTGWVAYSNVLTANSEGKTKTATRKVSSAYTPTAALRQSTVRRYTEQVGKTNPQAAQALRGLATGPTTYEQRYLAIIQGSGLRNNDAADALASYLLVGWMIANDVRDGNAVTVPMAQGVRAQAARQLSANPKLSSAGVLAELGEELKLQAVILQLGWEEAIRSNQGPTYQQAIAGRFKREYGLDLTALRLSSQGFGQK